MQFTGLGKVLLAPRLTVFLLLVLLLAVAARINDGFLSLYLLERGPAKPSSARPGWFPP
ncbi:hypothetical protein N6H14_33010 [Paenibacillus sp. CC-CFT747]|nr:hypothetical protein N6H14_33010 [Paenibacillus sp. CC-CFT747]